MPVPALEDAAAAARALGGAVRRPAAPVVTRRLTMASASSTRSGVLVVTTLASSVPALTHKLVGRLGEPAGAQALLSTFVSHLTQAGTVPPPGLLFVAEVVHGQTHAVVSSRPPVTARAVPSLPAVPAAAAPNTAPAALVMGAASRLPGRASSSQGSGNFIAAIIVAALVSCTCVGGAGVVMLQLFRLELRKARSERMPLNSAATFVGYSTDGAPTGAAEATTSVLVADDGPLLSTVSPA